MDAAWVHPRKSALFAPSRVAKITREHPSRRGRREGARLALHALLLLLALVFAPRPAGATEPRSALAAGTSVSLSAQSTQAATSPDDDGDVASDSPRVSVQHFLEQCRASQWDGAASYMDLSRPADAKRGRELAEELCAVLNRKLRPDADDLSPLSSGRKIDGLPAGTDEIGRIATTAGTRAPVRMVKRDAHDGDDARWIFSQGTITHVDDWYDTLGDRTMRRVLPPALLREGPHGFLLWQLLAMVPVLVTAWFSGRAIANGVTAVLGKLARKERTRATLKDARRALALLAAVALLRVALPWAGFYIAAYDLVTRALASGGALGVVWLVIVASRTTAGVLREHGAETPGRLALISLGERAARVALVVIGVVIVVSEFGYQVSTLVTGLGIGGIAVALAAQKTLENLFGSIAILADQPFRIGELVRIDGTEGTIETIGLRSTRIRTFDRTVVVIPNGKLADMKVESFGTRDRFRLQVKLDLKASNDPAKVEALLAELRTKVAAREAVLPGELFVQGQRLTLGVIEVEIMGYVKGNDIAAFYAEREAVVLMTLALAKTHGVALAERIEART